MAEPGPWSLPTDAWTVARVSDPRPAGPWSAILDPVAPILDPVAVFVFVLTWCPVFVIWCPGLQTPGEIIR